MTGQKARSRPAIAIVCATLLVALALPVFAADPPTAELTITGDPVPGANVTVKATITIKDGSALQSVKWTQTGGVHATVANGNAETITLTVPTRKEFREHLIEILEEAPIPEANYPANVPVREFFGGLQDRFTIVGSSPHAVVDVANLVFDLAVTTTSGTYHLPVTVAAKLPYFQSLGVQAVPIDVPVILHGKTQATYNWTLTVPTGSNAKLLDANTQSPEFTPDIKGTYKLAVTDLASGKAVSISVYAGTWKGMVAGQDADGRPVALRECTMCHAGKIEMFTPWAKTGHAEIFKDNVVNTAASAHYTQSCLSCHTVGFNKNAVNGGFDDAADFAGLAASGMIEHGAVDNWSKILKDFPKSAQLANIQCENCHGPQDTEAHAQWGTARISTSSDVCSTCHGEPKRHGRFQQWQLSAHANFETAVGEGTNAGCAKCHSAQGFIQWSKAGFGTTPIDTKGWDAESVQPITCAVCHDPHAVGTTSGSAATNAPMRLQGTTPMLDAGFIVKDVGKAAICMTCHNSRRGLKNDTIPVTDFSRATHLGPQTDILMGQNLYFTKVGTAGFHSKIADSCISCHMEKTNPPADLANKNADGSYGGTNHTFFASTAICTKCHTSIDVASFRENVEHKMETLKAEIEAALKNTMQAQIRAGNTIEFATTPVIRVKNAAEILSVEYIESHGRQGANVKLSDNRTAADLALNSLKVVRPAGGSVEILAVADPSLAKAGWNYWMLHSDGSEGIHNPAFANSALDVAIFAVKALNSTTLPYNPLAGGVAKIGGGLGNGAGAVSCTTPYVYWTEVAGHAPGNAGSQWRTDLVARNLVATNASLRFILHSNGANIEGTGLVPANGQAAFEDIVAAIGGTNVIGSLEVCSDQPLLVRSRIYNQSPEGTFGQNYDGQVADVGFGVGQTVSLVGLRQNAGAFRTNIIVTNAGKTEAEVSVKLFDAVGTELKTYTLALPAGRAIIDTEPFANRAGKADLGWGFATVTVTKGSNVWASASMVDAKTNDPITIPAKQ